MASSSAERKANQRAKAKEAGNCSECCTGKPETDYDTCQKCITNRIERWKRQKERQ